MFTINELGEYWQSHCIVCLGDVYAFRVSDVHFLFQDDLSVLIGQPICKSCYNDLKDEIPEHIDLIKKSEIKKSVLKSLPEQIFDNIEKTHQPKPNSQKKIMDFIYENNIYDFNFCVRCKKPRKSDHTLTADDLRNIGCNIKGNWACLPVCYFCYHDHLNYKLKGVIK